MLHYISCGGDLSLKTLVANILHPNSEKNSQNLKVHESYCLSRQLNTEHH